MPQLGYLALSERASSANAIAVSLLDVQASGARPLCVILHGNSHQQDGRKFGSLCAYGMPAVPPLGHSGPGDVMQRMLRRYTT